MVRAKGLEPSWGCPHTDLNRTRLPIPPHPHMLCDASKDYTYFAWEMQGEVSRFFKIACRVRETSGLVRAWGPCRAVPAPRPRPERAPAHAGWAGLQHACGLACTAPCSRRGGRHAFPATAPGRIAPLPAHRTAAPYRKCTAGHPPSPRWRALRPRSAPRRPSS